MAGEWDVVSESADWEVVGDSPITDPSKPYIGMRPLRRAPLKPAPVSVLETAAWEPAPRTTNPAAILPQPADPVAAGMEALFNARTPVQSAVASIASQARERRRQQQIVNQARESTDAAFGGPVGQAVMALPRRLTAGAAQVVGGVAGIPQLFGSDVGAETAAAMDLMAKANMPEDPSIADEIASGLGQVFPMIRGAMAVRAAATPVLGAEGATALATGASGGVGGAMSGGAVLRELEPREDLGSDDKQLRALGAAIFSALTGAKADRFLLPGATPAGDVFTAARQAFAREGLQEGADQAMQNLFTDKPVGEGVLRAGAVGGVVGGLTRAVNETGSDAFQLSSALDADAAALTNQPPPRSVWAPVQPVAAPAPGWEVVAETPITRGESDAQKQPIGPGSGGNVDAVGGNPGGAPADQRAPAQAAAPQPPATVGDPGATAGEALNGTAPAPAAGQPVPADPTATGARPDIPADGAVANAPVPPPGRPADAVQPPDPVATDAAGRGQDAGQGALTPPPVAAPAPAQVTANTPDAAVAPPAASTGSTAQSIRQELHQRYGQKTIDALERAGVLKIWDRADEFNAQQAQGSRAVADGDTQGMYFKGTAHLFGSGIQPGLAVPVMLHESGEHAGMKKMLGDQRYGDLVRRAFQLASDGDTHASNALARIPDQTNPKFFDSEMVAYLIEEAAAARASASPALRQWLADLVAAIRAWAYTTPLAQKLSAAGVDLKLTPEDIVALAERSIRQQAKEAGRALAARPAQAATPKPSAGAASGQETSPEPATSQASVAPAVEPQAAPPTPAVDERRAGQIKKRQAVLRNLLDCVGRD